MRNKNYYYSLKKCFQPWGSIFLAMILMFSSFLIFNPQNLKISSAEYCPSSTEGDYNDFINGTYDYVQVLETCKGNELRLEMYEDCIWLNITSTTKPAPRMFYQMAAVHGTDKIVLYGGAYGFAQYHWYNDTWVYDHSDNTWTQKFPVNCPGNRSESAMAAIWGTDKVMIIGGAVGVDKTSNDTWIYDLSDNNWTRKYPINQPKNITAHSMTSIPCTDKVLLFGGYFPPFNIPRYNRSNETWIYDLSDNNWTRIITDPTPAANCAYQMSFIYNTDKIVLFGGKWWLLQYPYHEANCTWIFDYSDMKWINASPINSPGLISDTAMAPIYGTDKVLIFCGQSLLPNHQVYGHNETWVYDLSENTWTKMLPNNPPHLRQGHQIVSIFGTNKIIMFGGVTHYYLDDTWEFKFGNYYYNGSYISPPSYIGPNASLKSISWNGSVATNTSIKFQVRTANSELELNSKPFVGFDGSPDSYYTISPSATWSEHNNQPWMQYKAYLSASNYNETPILRYVSFVYNYWPNTTLVNPKYGSIRVDNRPDFTWNFTDRDSISQEGYQVLIDDDSEFQSIDYDSGEQSGNVSSWRFSNGTTYTTLPDGTWYWKARTKDNDGDWGLYSKPWKIIIDTIAPTSVITQPENNITYNHLEKVFGTAMDPPPGTSVKSVEISIKRLCDDKYWNGSTWLSNETWLLSTGTNDWSYDVSSINWTLGIEYLENPMTTDNATKEFWRSIGKYRVQSQATDIASNQEIPKIGKIFTYDSEGVSFSNPKPPPGFESTFEDVEVGITITDLISGVDAKTIEYTVSIDAGQTWSAWTPVYGYENGSEVNVTLNLSFKNGTGNLIKWRAVDIAGNGPTESHVYMIKVNTLLKIFIPSVRLRSPPIGSIIPSTSVALYWRLENTNLLNVNVTFDLYFDTVKPVEPRERGIIGTYWEIHDLIDGETYYWTVIPSTDSYVGYCISGTWEFTVDLSIPYPKVKLISPENGSILTSLNPVLAWETKYNGSESLSYDVYLDTDPKPFNFTTGHLSRQFSPTLNLVNGKTYYWRIVPWAGKISGLPSKVWSFTIAPINTYKFDLELYISPSKLKLYPGNYATVKATVKNLGDIADNYMINITIPNEEKIVYRIMNSSTVKLTPLESHEFEIFIQLPKTAIPGIIVMNMEATSGNSIDQGSLVNKNATLVIMVSKLDKAKELGTTIEDIWVSILFMIIIFVIIICVIILIMKRKKKDDEEEKPPEESVTVKPSVEPAAVITIEQEEQLPDIPAQEQLPVTQSQEQLPVTTEASETQVQGIESPDTVPQQPPFEGEKNEINHSDGGQISEE